MRSRVRVPRREVAALVAAAIVVAIDLATPCASAQVLERFSVHGEGGVDLLVGGTPADRFGVGAHGIGRLGFRVIGAASIQISGGGWWFSPRQSAQSAAGSLDSFEGGIRIAPRPWQGTLGGPVFDVNAGLGYTGTLSLPMLDVGLGWEFAPARALAIGPIVRYAEVFDGRANGEDARLLMIDLAITLRVPAREIATPTPRADHDGDGVVDEADRCPDQAEDRDGFNDADGCPDPDNDADGFLDAADRCPDRAETRNGFEDEDGCPDEPPPAAMASAAPASSPAPEAERAVAREPAHLPYDVHFGYGSAHLRAHAEDTIHALCVHLRQAGGTVRVRAVGHADERGPAQNNLELSTWRAGAAAGALVHCGFASSRVEPVGLGEAHPLCTDATRECRYRNRRVEFFIIEP